MKRKDLYNFVREEIVNELKANENVAVELTGTTQKTVQSFKDLTAANKFKSENPNVKAVKALEEEELEEMARKANTLKVGDQEKFEAAKDLYEGGWIANLLNFIAEAGEEGISQKDLAEKLGKKDSANINPAIQELKMVKAIATTRIKGDEAPEEEEAPEAETADAPEVEAPEEDTFYKADTEFDTPEEEPKAADIKAAEKIVGKGHAKTLSPEEEEKYSKIRKGIETKVSKLLKLPKAKRNTSDDIKILRQLITREDVKKLFKDKGVSLKDIVADVMG